MTIRSGTSNNQIFQPLQITDKIKNLYADYIWGTFPLDHPIYSERFDKLLREDDTLWNGPYVSLAQNYSTTTLPAGDVLHKMGIDELTINAFSVEKLYSHQEQAIKQLSAGVDTLVSTGTGSGKTEAFLLPIVDYCVKARTKGLSGLKAIIIYPMNALANDQHERLRKILYEVNLRQDRKITLAKYTGATPRKQKLTEHPENFPSQKCPLNDTRANKVGCLSYCNNRVQFQPDIRLPNFALRCQQNQDVSVDYELICRDDIEAAPPDILITNYVQLEYLLLNKSTESIFTSPNLHFVVFDEVHTYAGARGIEVALLLRRLRERVRPFLTKGLVHVGTSATISSGEDPKAEIAKFASDFFGVTISQDQVVLGTTIPYKPEETLLSPPSESLEGPLEIQRETTLAQIRPLIDSLLPKEAIQQLLSDSSATTILGRVLRKNRLFSMLVQELSEPRSIDDLIDSIRNNEDLDQKIRSLSSEDLKKLIWTYLIVGSQANDPTVSGKEDDVPLIRPNVHIYFRTVGQSFPFGELFVCLGCGRFHDGVALTCPICTKILEELGLCRGCGRTFYKGYYSDRLDVGGKKVMREAGIEKEFGKTRTLEPDSPTIWFADEEIHLDTFIKAKKCRQCGFLSDTKTEKCPKGHSEWITGSAAPRIPVCPHCDYSGGSLEAVSSVYLSPNVTSRVIFEFAFSLLPKDQRRLLVFSDSRQDASFLAGTIEYEHKVHMMRQVIYQTLKKHRRAVNIKSLHELIDLKLQDVIGDAYNAYMQGQVEDDLLLEVSTSRARRKSLESLGLMRVTYRGLPEFATWISENPDDQIAEQLKKWGIAPNVFGDYLCQLLNIMRWDGALEGIEKLPPSGHDIPIGYTLNPTIPKARTRKYEIKQPFHNASSAHRLTAKLFSNSKSQEILRFAFGYLSKRTYIVEKEIRPASRRGTPSPKGWLVSTDKIILALPDSLMRCVKCKTITTLENLPLCIGRRCHEGKPPRVDAEAYYADATAFHIHWYRNEEPVRLLAQEDTGALSTEKRQQVEGDFKSGKVDLVACTPTLELGIDIGDLVSVAMAKSPPSPANYVQRAGRAGRRSRISLIINFAFQSKIDQYYFNSPAEMIRGRVRPPFISLKNRTLVKRHAHSILIENIFVLGAEAQNFTQAAGAQNFINLNYIDPLRRIVADKRSQLVQKVCQAFTDIDWLTKEIVASWVDGFPDAVNVALDQYQADIKELEERKREVREKMDGLSTKDRALRPDEFNERERLRWVEKHLDARLDSPTDGLLGRNTVQQFAATGVTPRYTFPGKQLTVLTADQEFAGERQKSTGLSEVVPGAPVYFGKRKYLAIGFDFTQGVPYVDFSFCSTCKTHVVEGLRQKGDCPLCGRETDFESIKTCVSPATAVIGAKKEARTEGREYVRADVDSFLKKVQPAKDRRTSQSKLGTINSLGQVEILSVVNGLNTEDGFQTFNLCRECGNDITRFSVSKGHYLFKGSRECRGQGDPTKLYHTFSSEAVSLDIPPALLSAEAITADVKEKFLVTLANALVGGIELFASASEGEVGYLIKQNTNSIILFDNVEGGVGFVEAASQHFDEIILGISGRLLADCGCEVGCPRCLYSYRRKRDIPFIDKGLIAPLFRRLKAEMAAHEILAKGKTSTHYKGFNIRSISSNIGSLEGAIELKDLLLGASKTIDVACFYIVDSRIPWPDGSTASWVSVLTRCVLNRVKVRVFVRVPRSISETRSLKKLKDAGVEVFVFPKPGIESQYFDSKAHLKQVVIDHGAIENACAIHMSANMSAETYKNADFYDFGIGKENAEWVNGTREFIQKIASNSTPYEG